MRWSSAILRKRLRNSLKSDKNQGLQSTLEAISSDTPASDILRLLKPFRPSSNKAFWGSRPLPHALQDDGCPCETPEALLDAWVDHFRQMEGGIRLPPGAIS